MPPPPLRSPAEEQAGRALARATTLARASALVLIVLAAVSTLVNALHPLTGHFLISLIVLAQGIIEWRLARALQRHDARAPGRLALNQVVLGFALLGYGAWRLLVFSPDEILQVLQRPALQPLLAALPPEELRLMVERLPPLVFALLAVVSALTALGCWAMALYYRSLRKYLLTGHGT